MAILSVSGSQYSCFENIIRMGLGNIYYYILTLLRIYACVTKRFFVYKYQQCLDLLKRYAYTLIRVHVYVWSCMHKFMYVCVYVRMCVRAYKYTYMNLYMYVVKMYVCIRMLRKTSFQCSHGSGVVNVMVHAGCLFTP